MLARDRLGTAERSLIHRRVSTLRKFLPNVSRDRSTHVIASRALIALRDVDVTSVQNTLAVPVRVHRYVIQHLRDGWCRPRDSECLSSDHLRERYALGPE